MKRSLGNFKGTQLEREELARKAWQRSQQSRACGFFMQQLPVAFGATIIAFFSVAGIATIVIHLLK